MEVLWSMIECTAWYVLYVHMPHHAQRTGSWLHGGCACVHCPDSLLIFDCFISVESTPTLSVGQVAAAYNSLSSTWRGKQRPRSPDLRLVFRTRGVGSRDPVQKNVLPRRKSPSTARLAIAIAYLLWCDGRFRSTGMRSFFSKERRNPVLQLREACDGQ